MAVTRDNNVIMVGATADTITGHHLIQSIKVVGGASGATVSIRRTNVSGAILYTKTVAANTESLEEANIRNHGGTLYFEITGANGNAMLYLK
jgi:hypothetical protein